MGLHKEVRDWLMARFGKHFVEFDKNVHGAKFNSVMIVDVLTEVRKMPTRTLARESHKAGHNVTMVTWNNMLFDLNEWVNSMLSQGYHTIVLKSDNYPLTPNKRKAATRAKRKKNSYGRAPPYGINPDHCKTPEDLVRACWLDEKTNELRFGHPRLQNASFDDMAELAREFNKDKPLSDAEFAEFLEDVSNLAKPLLHMDPERVSATSHLRQLLMRNWKAQFGTWASENLKAAGDRHHTGFVYTVTQRVILDMTHGPEEAPIEYTKAGARVLQALRNPFGEFDVAMPFWMQVFSASNARFHVSSTDTDVIGTILLTLMMLANESPAAELPQVYWHYGERRKNDNGRMTTTPAAVDMTQLYSELTENGKVLPVWLVYGAILCGTDFVEKSDVTHMVGAKTVLDKAYASRHDLQTIGPPDEVFTDTEECVWKNILPSRYPSLQGLPEPAPAAAPDEPEEFSANVAASAFDALNGIAPSSRKRKAETDEPEPRVEKKGPAVAPRGALYAHRHKSSNVALRTLDKFARSVRKSKDSLEPSSVVDVLWNVNYWIVPRIAARYSI